MATAQVELPPKLIPVFAPPRGSVRYRGAYGGRGSAKSFNFAKMAAVFGYAEPLRILCTRDMQVSIKESFHAELKNAIASEPWLASFYDVGVDYIRGANGTEFLFKGLRHNMSNIKSMAQIDICIVEEAEDVAESSWVDLEPTIRAEKSEIWPIWNPKKENSPVDVRFRKNQAARAIIVEMNHRDNPWFPDELRELMERDRKMFDPGKFNHIWEGAYLKLSEVSVFKNWKIEEFEAEDSDILRFGGDWGYSVDPSVLVRCFVRGHRLYVEHEAYMVGCEIVDLPALFATVPDSNKWIITADSARPETISHLRRHGYPKIVPALKGAKSLEEGVAFMQSFEIVVHPRCIHSIQELTDYSFKTDKDTGQVLPVFEDKDNHVIDSIRYALEALRRAKKPKEKQIARRPAGLGWG